jgi:hypothetical protein
MGTLKALEKTPPLPIIPAPVQEQTDAFEDEEEVFCNCCLPYKAGELMFKCEGFCGNWYHPACVGIISAEIERQKNTTERWYCPDCLKEAYDIMVTSTSHKREHKKLKYK